MSGRAATLARLVLPVAVMLGLPACSEYLERRDSLLLGSGEAVQTNIVAHVIDPWPARSRRTSVDTDGQRLQGAVERYRNPGTGSAPGAAPNAPSAPGSAPPTLR